MLSQQMPRTFLFDFLEAGLKIIPYPNSLREKKKRETYQSLRCIITERDS